MREAWTGEVACLRHKWDISQQEIAYEMEYNREYVSNVLAGRIKGKTQGMQNLILLTTRKMAEEKRRAGFKPRPLWACEVVEQLFLHGVYQKNVARAIKKSCVTVSKVLSGTYQSPSEELEYQIRKAAERLCRERREREDAEVKTV